MKKVCRSDGCFGYEGVTGYNIKHVGHRIVFYYLCSWELLEKLNIPWLNNNIVFPYLGCGVYVSVSGTPFHMTPHYTVQ